MPANKKILVLPGDGIGPEVMHEVRRVIDWLDRRRSLTFQIEEGLVGGAAIDATGTPCPDETVAKALAADAVLFGSVGGPKWDSPSTSGRNSASCGCGRTWACVPISARPWCSTRWPMRRR